MAISDLKLSIAIIAVIAVSFCSAKSLGSSADTFQESTPAQPNITACEDCNSLVWYWDNISGPPAKTPEALAQGIKEHCKPPPFDEIFCKAIDKKELPFAEAWFKHKQHPEVNPCEEVKICPDHQ
ncbi:hypothetical protein Ddc_16555 [Ditylenchus destructor]|nr:hypothetical protein Ddc_16555 [Ditylenchus destructor]